jgi:hypothetical protein
MNWLPNDPCDPIWEHADWLPVWYLLDRWCRQDARCHQAKQQALLSACERGEIDAATARPSTTRCMTCTRGTSC